MAMHRHIGFLEEEKMLNAVDSDFRELVRLSYQIPGFGSYGVSCSGHFYPANKDGYFLPSPWGSLGFAALPQENHIQELLGLISETTKSDPDARLSINDNKNPPINFPLYTSESDLSKYAIEKTSRGIYVAVLEVRLGDNGCLDTYPNRVYCSSIKLEGHELEFEKSRQRYQEIQRFWKLLEDKVREYTQKNQFISPPDYTKPEFLPFG